jgi:hypothetical protein
MRHLITSAAVVAAIGLGANAAMPAPTFEQYRVPVFSGTSASVRLGSHPQAQTFRTVLREAARKGPNFAGHFTVATWGCGTNCIVVAIIDARNGRVFFPFNREAVSTPREMDAAVPTFRYRADSRLFIVAGGVPSHGEFGVARLLWNGSKFEELSFEAKDEWQ